MTAVIAILNKRGMALAADSAVTWSKDFVGKVTKNGNKMVRLSDVVPISVMLTGNGAFLNTTWDIIIRHYRHLRGNIPHETVEACVQDFFQFIADNHLFCDKTQVKGFINSELTTIYNSIAESINCEIYSIEEQIMKSEGIIEDFKEMLEFQRDTCFDGQVCPQFKDYTQARFHEYAGPLVTDFLKQRVADEESMFFSEYCFPREVLFAVQGDLETTLLAKLTTRRYREDFSAELIFTGYGVGQTYPSLVAVSVYEGFDDRVNYYYGPKDVVTISDECPAAICPFAQDDIVESILRGMHESYYHALVDETIEALNPLFSNVLNTNELDASSGSDDALFDDDSLGDDLFNDYEEPAWDLFYSVKTSDLENRFKTACARHVKANRNQWVKALQNYDLPSMAALAESLIELTGFQRIITFSEEGVGGPVDLAVVTKTDGFVWMNRKSWYHHKDTNGQYGKLGV